MSGERLWTKATGVFVDVDGVARSRESSRTASRADVSVEGMMDGVRFASMGRGRSAGPPGRAFPCGLRDLGLLASLAANVARGTARRNSFERSLTTKTTLEASMGNRMERLGGTSGPSLPGGAFQDDAGSANGKPDGTFQPLMQVLASRRAFQKVSGNPRTPGFSSGGGRDKSDHRSVRNRAGRSGRHRPHAAPDWSSPGA